MKYINLKIPEHSYFFGFVQTDGNLNKPFERRDKGRLRIELGKEDLHILKSFKQLFSSVYSSITNRTRDTNFKAHYRSYTFNIYDLKFRKELYKLGVPHGKKSKDISFPKDNFLERDYIRGLIDGDGSVGITGKGFPFISFSVKSEEMKGYFSDIIEKVIGERKRLNRNKRDDTYNIMVNREKAQKFIKYLYYPNCLALKRKLKKAKIALKWKRPKSIKRRLRKFWEEWEEKYILTHTMEESCDRFKRTKSSVKNKLWDLKINKTKI